MVSTNVTKFTLTKKRIERKRHCIGDADASDLIHVAPVKMLRDILQGVAEGLFEENDSVSVSVHNQDDKELRASWTIQEVRKEFNRRLGPVN